jgi:hypothetical protein
MSRAWFFVGSIAPRPDLGSEFDDIKAGIAKDRADEI